MKIFLLSLFIVYGVVAHAGDDDAEKFPIFINLSEKVEPEANHLPLKDVKLSLPVEAHGLKLVALQLQYGEVTEFIIPLQYGVHDGVAHASFSVAPHYLASLEVLYIYSGHRNVLIQKLINT